jgi:hypothetical protein
VHGQALRDARAENKAYNIPYDCDGDLKKSAEYKKTSVILCRVAILPENQLKQAKYLSGYIENHTQTPEISLDSIIKSVGLIEQMGRERLKRPGAQETRHKRLTITKRALRSGSGKSHFLVVLK